MKSHRATPHYFLAAFVAGLLLLTGAASRAQTTYSWSTNGTATLGGSGTWDLVLSNWWTGAKAKWPATGTANVAVFAGPAGTVTNAADMSVNQIRFNTNTGYVLTTDGSTRTLTLNGTAPEIYVTNAVAATIGNSNALVLAGTAGLTKTGAGTLILNGSTTNSFTGGLNVKGGNLTLNYSNMATPTDLINSANALALGGLGASTNTLSLLGNTTGTTSQTFASTATSLGNSTISLNRNGGTSTTLNLGQLTLNTGSVLFFQPATAWTTTPSTTEIVKLTTGGSVTVPVSGVAYASAKMMNNTGTSTRWVQVDTNGQLVNMVTSTGLSATSADPTVGNSIGGADVTFTTPNASSYGLLDNANGATRNIFITNGVTYTLNGIIGSS